MATAFSIEMVENLERALEQPDMTPELAELLITETVGLTYDVTTRIDVDNE